MKSQNVVEILPEANKPNEEISMDFAGPFQNANMKKHYLLVSLDNHSGRPEALLLPNLTSEDVPDFLADCISKTIIPKKTRRDASTVFKSKKYKQLVRKSSSII